MQKWLILFGAPFNTLSLARRYFKHLQLNSK